MWRCANDSIFGLCSGEPDWDVQPTEIEKKDREGNVVGFSMTGGSCKLDHKTCGKYTTRKKESYPETAGHYEHRVLKDMTNKKSTKKVAKVEADVKQGELF